VSAGTDQLTPGANVANKQISISFDPPVLSCNRRRCKRLDALAQLVNASNVEFKCVKPRFGLIV